ncbi:MAG: adenylate/guanylate cyclase domain-containing protein, partial [Chloroflexota bacterium]
MTSGPREVSRRTAAVRAFLIADIRGYTRFTARRGDEAASGLARRFADVAGEAVEAWGGELVELRGDEALAVFDSARQALRCAVELQDAFADETAADSDVPLQVGIGLDAGEAVPVDDGYRGAALNLAARLCSAAAGGETLASATILNLAGPMPDLAIEALIPRSLKGFEHTVEAASVAPAAPMRSDAITKVARAGEGDEDRPSTALGTELPAELD